MSKIKCRFCGSNKYRKNGIRLQNKGNVQIYECKECGKSFSLDSQKKIALPAEILCSKCKSINTVKVGKPEQRSHGLVQPCKCKDCGKYFTLGGRKKPALPAEAACPNCGSFKTIKISKPRQRSYGLVQECKCKDCGKSFSLGTRKLQKIYLNKKVIHTYWNPPGLKYIDRSCPNCQAAKTILTNEFWSNKLQRQIQKSICEKCGQLSTQQGNGWNNGQLRKLGKEIPIVPWKFEDNLWDLRFLYPQIEQYKLEQIFLNFKNCGDQSFINLVKLYILDKIKESKKPRTLIDNLSKLRQFGNFIQKNSLISLDLLNRDLLNIYWTQNLSHLTTTSLYSRMIVVREFLNWGNENGYFNTSSNLITLLFDLPKIFHNDPDPLEDFILEAIRDNLHILPKPIQLMFILGAWLGTRVGELCNLPKNCLVEVSLKSNDSDKKVIIEWWLQFERDKSQDEHRLPLTADLVAAIKEQQEYITQIWGEDYPYLFCHYQNIKRKDYPIYKKMKPIQRPPLVSIMSNPMVKIIRHLIEFCEIRDSNRQLAHFTGAVLRPTRASELIQNGYSLEFVRLWLKHRHASTTKRHYARYRPGELLDVATVMANLENKFYPYESDPGSIERKLEELRQNPDLHEIDGLIMPNGEPLIGYCLNREFCPKFGACYLCGYHIASSDKLPLYRDQLARLKIKEQKAIKYWSAERLESYRSLIKALEGKIQALEEIIDE